MNSKHLPQGLTDWLGIAGFVLGLLALGTDWVARYRARAAITVETPNRSVDRKLPWSFSVKDPLPENATITWSVSENRVEARVNGVAANIAVEIQGRPVDITRPLSVRAIATNHGSQPLRFVSATATYGTVVGNLKQVTKRFDAMLDAERRRAVVDVAVKDSALLSIPLAVALLDERGRCHVKFIEGPGKSAFGTLLANRPSRTFCSDPDLSDVISIP